MLRKLLATAALALAAGPSQAADWVAQGSLGTGTSASGSSLVLTTSATLEAGNFAVCVVSKDEHGTGTTDGSGNAEFTSATDSASNTWTERRETCNMQTASTEDGACVAIYTSQATSQLNSGGTITFTLLASTVRSTVTCQEYTIPSGATVGTAVFQGVNTFVDEFFDGADVGSFTFDQWTIDSREMLWVDAIGAEGLDTGFTVDSDYTGFTAVASSSGVAATSNRAFGQYRIAKEADTPADDPTVTTAGDTAVIHMGFALNSPVRSWWVDRGTAGKTGTASTSTTIALTTDAQTSVGDVAVCAIGHDEITTSTSNGDFSEVTGVADSGGNTWLKMGEFCNVRTSSAADGYCVDIWAAKAVSQIANGGTITATFSATTTSRTIVCERFNGAQSVGTVANSFVANRFKATDATVAADPGATAPAFVIPEQRLEVRATGCETNVTTFTTDTGYLTFQNLVALANSGVAATSGILAADFRIAAEATADSNDPTGSAVDCASLEVGIEGYPSNNQRGPTSARPSGPQ